jgi:hypothetical protein
MVSTTGKPSAADTTVPRPTLWHRLRRQDEPGNVTHFAVALMVNNP